MTTMTTTTVECVRAVITKLETEPPEKRNVNRDDDDDDDDDGNGGGDVNEKIGFDNNNKIDWNDKYGVSISLSRAELDKVNKEQKTPPCLFRVCSNVEKRIISNNINNNNNSNEVKVERSKSLKLVERSTSFGRSDTMRIIGEVERSIMDGKNPNLSVSDASSQTDLLEGEERGGEKQQQQLQQPVRDEETIKKMEEELECERLSRDLASQLSPSDKLQSLLGEEIKTFFRF